MFTGDHSPPWMSMWIPGQHPNPKGLRTLMGAERPLTLTGYTAKKIKELCLR